MGAITQLYAGLSPETTNVTGEWFRPFAALDKELNPDLMDPTTEGELWDWIEEQRKEHM